MRALLSERARFHEEGALQSSQGSGTMAAQRGAECKRCRCWPPRGKQLPGNKKD